MRSQLLLISVNFIGRCELRRILYLALVLKVDAIAIFLYLTLIFYLVLQTGTEQSQT